MNPIPQNFIKQICQENGQNTKKDAERAANLNSHIFTGFTSQGCFIYELLQNADDQLSLNSEVHFDFNQKELIFYHHGDPFDKEDVQAICSYGNELPIPFSPFCFSKLSFNSGSKRVPLPC
jgi:hypothetical protein